MRIVEGRLVASPTDLANFLTCRHKTALDLRVAAGTLQKPRWQDPLAEILQKRGKDHERAYVARLHTEGWTVVDLENVPPGDRVARTLEALRARKADVIVQGALENDRWSGFPDILRKTADGFEVLDTKLSRETRGGTILQLCVYTDLLTQALGEAVPDYFHVVTPLASEAYRFSEYGSYYRFIKSRFVEFTAAERGSVDRPPATYPEPVEHCGVCRWSGRCAKERRKDDHLSFVAGLARQHVRELADQGISTLTALAGTPLPLTFTPARGARETFEKLREQARLQLEQRTSGKPVYECLPVESGFGLAALPEPRPGDLFLDLEGDPFGRPGAGPAAGEGQREYLFGLGRIGPDGTFRYVARWAFSDGEERTAFDETMSDIMAALDADPEIHIYHYGHYEPSAFKRLMGRYAAREVDVDRLLRGHRFVDLLNVVRRGIRAGVESYSIKCLEPFYEFARDVALDTAGDQRRLVEVALETGDLTTVTDGIRSTVEGYNRDDVRSTWALRDWLEARRQGLIDAGTEVSRPVATEDAAPDKVDDRAQRVETLRTRLLDGVSVDPVERSADLQARYHLSYLLDWHRREDKAEWWDYYRLRELPEDDLLDEPRAVAGLTWIGDLGMVRRSTLRRYSFPEQEFEIRPGDTLKTQDGKVFTDEIQSIDRLARTIDLVVGPSRTGVHPRALFAHKYFPKTEMEGSLSALGELVAVAGGVEQLPLCPARSLLLRLPPSLASAPFAAPVADVVKYATSIVNDLDRSALSIQGPPGSGKTFTGARMIEALVAKGKKVGVLANSHKVIRNLLKEIGGPDARLGHKLSKEDGDLADGGGRVAVYFDNKAPLAALGAGDINVLGGTAFLWSREDYADSVEVLFVDEAGQVSLANVLGVCRAAKAIVLLGDPQQLDQPSKGSHPDGVGASALQHVLGPAATMPADRGLFLPVTWRLAPAICSFTSESFYAGQLTPKPGLEHQALTGTGVFDGAGLCLVGVDHDGNQNASDEEAEAIAGIIDRLLSEGSMWIDEHGTSREIGPDDIRVITPFNAQVARIREVLQRRNPKCALVPVGTVDKFQGQQAPVSIYSMATSHPDDAPKGMEFLYSLNRLNVATSRARCAAIVVASPRLFEPDCQTPRRMRLANALARFREMAATIPVE
jgi:predicted RecB family nuclease